MENRSENATKRRLFGKDELNLAEFPLSLVGKRAPGAAKTIQFEDEVWDRGAGRLVARRLTVTSTDLLGLPTAVDDEVLVGCIKLTKDQGFKQPKILFTPYEFLELLGWPRDGRAYRRLSQSLDRWAGTLVISDNAFWHKGRQKWVKDTINIIDRARFYRGGDDDPECGKKSWFLWGNFMWESFAAGNLRSLDFEFWRALERPVAKRLFRLLEKRFHHRGEARFPLKTLAFEKVGLSRNMHTGQVKAKLTPSHEELFAKGFCSAEYVRRGRGDWEVVYRDLRRGRGKPAAVSHPPSPLERELTERGLKNAAELVAKAPGQRVREALENYDDRRRHGEEVGPGWLGKCITHEVGFGFRKGYLPEAERRARAESAVETERAERRRQAEAEQEDERRCAEERQALARFLASLPTDRERARYADRALAASPIYARFFREAAAAGDRERAERHRREAVLLFWRKERPQTVPPTG